VAGKRKKVTNKRMEPYFHPETEKESKKEKAATKTLKGDEKLKKKEVGFSN